MSTADIFEYEVDWVNHFESVLRNEIREEIQNRNRIKTRIVESNQPFQDFLKRHGEISSIPSRESHFHNLTMRRDEKQLKFYLDVRDPRFWLVHTIEAANDASSAIDNVVSNSYLQDKIYLSSKVIQDHHSKMGASSLGFTLSFNQLFSSVEEGEAGMEGTRVFRSELADFEDVFFTLQLWPKRKKSIAFFLQKFKEIDCPINYKSLNFVFEDANQQVLVKENLHSDGSFTIDRGNDFRTHLKFVDAVRERYHQEIQEVESFRVDWQAARGALFVIELNKEINQERFMNLINQPRVGGEVNPFKISAFKMYVEDDSIVYSCIDTHTGGQFFMQVFPNRITINLDKDACGNIVFRLFTNLQRQFSMAINLFVDGKRMDC